MKGHRVAALAAAALLLASAAGAHGDEDHGAPAQPIPAAKPPIKTRAALPGRVIADPRSTQRIAADQPGVIEAPAGGFPLPGSTVVAGQVLAYLRPSLSAPERRDLEGELSVARRDVQLGQLQVQRFNVADAEHLDISLPTPSLQILGEYRAAQARQSQLDQAQSGRVALRADRDGRLLHSRARSGQVIGVGDAVFELGAGPAPAVEALVTESGFKAAGVNRARNTQGREFPLRLLADRFDPALRARRLLFAVTGTDAPTVGETLQLLLDDAEGSGS